MTQCSDSDGGGGDGSRSAAAVTVTAVTMAVKWAGEMVAEERDGGGGDSPWSAVPEVAQTGAALEGVTTVNSTAARLRYATRCHPAC